MAKSQSAARHDRSHDHSASAPSRPLPKKKKKNPLESADLLTQSSGKYSARRLEAEVCVFRPRTQMNKYRNFKALLERFAMALFGDIALIGPMLLLVLLKDRATDLSRTSVATLLFAAIIARFSSGTREVIVGVLAAYTVVLVVFVGTLQ